MWLICSFHFAFLFQKFFMREILIKLYLNTTKYRRLDSSKIAVYKIISKIEIKLRCFCGSSSGVEHNLAKVGVAGSNPVSRSINLAPRRIMAKKIFLLFLSISFLFADNWLFIKKYIASLYKKEYPQIEIGKISLKSNSKIKFKKEDIYKLEIPKSYLKMSKGYIRVYLKNRKKISFRYEIEAKLKVFKTLKSIKKNQTISPLLLSETLIQFGYISNKPLTKNELKNIKAARYIKSGDILLKNMVKRKTSLEKGDKILAVLKEDGMVFMFPASLMKDADIGDIVFVKNEKGKKFKAKIISKTKAYIINE